MKIMHYSILLLLCLCAAARADDGQPDISTQFLQANQAYKSGDFAAAADGYEKLAASGVRNGELLYNLGNAYLKKGDTGRAILNYRTAEMFIPRDADLEANLQYALGQAQDKIDCAESESLLKTVCFWYTKLSCRELCFMFLAVNGLFWLLFIVRLFLRTDLLGIGLYVALFLSLLFGGSFGVKLYATLFIRSGVVLAREVMVRSGSSLSDTVLFKLHEGAELTATGEENEWLKITLCDGKKGWVQKSSIGIVQGG
ncbi:MAG: SH3 domain-containing protein [Proteobacteria bacterium]|nr:SH3 domain-containing protein [Pseudomonadota bacterium]